VSQVIWFLEYFIFSKDSKRAGISNINGFMTKRKLASFSNISLKENIFLSFYFSGDFSIFFILKLNKIIRRKIKTRKFKKTKSFV
jgi:hypothetical protein